jgi:hypothetical protein
MPPPHNAIPAPLPLLSPACTVAFMYTMQCSPMQSNPIQCIEPNSIQFILSIPSSHSSIQQKHMDIHPTQISNPVHSNPIHPIQSIQPNPIHCWLRVLVVRTGCGCGCCDEKSGCQVSVSPTAASPLFSSGSFVWL